MFRRLRSTKTYKNQWGFTAIELVIALAITSIIGGGITMAIFQIFTGNIHTSNHMIAVKQVQNAGHWLGHDARMAQDVDIGEGAAENPVGTKFPLTLTWTEWDGTLNQVTYSLENMTGGAKQLQRQHVTYDDDGSEIGNETYIAAKYLVPGSSNTHLDYTDGGLTLTVTATLGTGSHTASETRVYEVFPRPS